MKRKGYRVLRDGTLIGARGKQVGVINIEGYITAGVRFGGKRKHLPAHRLQAYQKFGDELFKEGILVRHLNGDSLDNSWDNIAIGTNQENMMDKPKRQRIRDAMTRKRFSNYQISEILTMREHGATYKEIGERFRVSKSTLSYLFNRAYYTGARTIPE